MPKFIDLTGCRFGELTVIRLTPYKQGNRLLWECVCDCGRAKIAKPSCLRNGDVTCCGFHRTKTFIANRIGAPSANRIYPKGTDTHSRIYTLWNAMKSRCYRPTHEAYPRYGGRGIVMCAAWLSFANFREWALSNGYSPLLTVDRINNDGIYEPANCRWVSAKEQSRNRRLGLVTLTAFGETRPLVDWAQDARSSVTYCQLGRRLMVPGRTPEFALTATEHEWRSLASIERESRRRQA